MTWADLMLRAIDPGQRAPEDASATRILDATVAEVAAHGARGLTIEGVARRAGVNRTTVYRRFGDRDALMGAMALREGQRLAEGIASAMSTADGPDDQFVEGFVAAVRLVDGHPIVSRLARLESQALVAAALAEDAALVRLGAGFLADSLRTFQAQGRGTHLDADEAGDTLARLFAAFVLLPVSVTVDVSTPDRAREYARRTLVPMFLGADVPGRAPAGGADGLA